MKFGDNLRELRKAKKMAQEDLAVKIGVSRQSVSKWETGDAYPEMNNILMLCKIFKCRINELVNDNMIDIDSLDEETKMKIVKLEKEEQKKIKGLSKAISIIAKVGKILGFIAIPITIIAMILIPYLIQNIEIRNDQIEWVGTKDIISLKKENDKYILVLNDFTIASSEEVTTNTKILEIIKGNSKISNILYIEVGLLILIVTITFIIMILKHLEKLFDNFYKGETPFTLENVNHMRKMAWLMIAIILIPNLGGLIFELILHKDLGVQFESFDFIEILFLFSMTYIFKYGYTIQLDSKGIMYSE